ncbi:MAG: hypothetical protein IT581_11010 [Verrucomicrobiales bacterium]|nr:hypothetical protein [Verrucomicrobiales bacterium]
MFKVSAYLYRSGFQEVFVDKRLPSEMKAFRGEGSDGVRSGGAMSELVVGISQSEDRSRPNWIKIFFPCVQPWIGSMVFRELQANFRVEIQDVLRSGAGPAAQEALVRMASTCAELATGIPDFSFERISDASIGSTKCSKVLVGVAFVAFAASGMLSFCWWSDHAMLVDLERGYGSLTNRVETMDAMLKSRNSTDEVNSTVFAANTNRLGEIEKSLVEMKSALTAVRNGEQGLRRLTMGGLILAPKGTVVPGFQVCDGKSVSLSDFPEFGVIMGLERSRKELRLPDLDEVAPDWHFLIRVK